MSNEFDSYGSGFDGEFSRDGQNGNGNGGSQKKRYRDEVFSRRVPAGKRTYFFDVKSTRSGEDFFVTITESKRVDDDRYEKHKVFLYKEDFGKFMTAMHEVVDYIKCECLPEYDFRDIPEVTTSEEDEGMEAVSDDERDALRQALL